MKNLKDYKRNKLRARLSFDEGYAERPIYSIKSTTTEKHKGLAMIKLIFDNFNLTIDNYLKYIEEETESLIEEVNGMSKEERPRLHRDEWGNLSSPFASKKKLV